MGQTYQDIIIDKEAAMHTYMYKELSAYLWEEAPCGVV